MSNNNMPPIPAILQRYVSKTKQGPVLWLGATATAQLAKEIEALEAKAASLDHNTSKSEDQPCPYLACGAEGTSYCSLAESASQERTKERTKLLVQAQELKSERDTLRRMADAMYDAIVAEHPLVPWPLSTPLHLYRTAFPKQP